ncbi:unnamed protein product, partial [Rotaria sordida]
MFSIGYDVLMLMMYNVNDVQ